MTADLFDDLPAPVSEENLADGAVLLRGFALTEAAALVSAAEEVMRQAPLRHMVTPGGRAMAVAMTNCGPLGWVSDRRGYRYQDTDPVSGAPWPAMPVAMVALATRAADHAGYPCFAPDACLVNAYRAGTRLSLHQDRDELDFAAPIVSVSLGLPAVFLFGGQARSGPVRRYRLAHGDVVVWGGASRLAFHGVAPLAAGVHPLLGERRINLTFRRAR